MPAETKHFSHALPIAVLVSGTGTNLEALLKTVHGREAKVVAVASNVAGVPALRRSRVRKVPTRVFPRDAYANRRERDEAMADWLSGLGVRLVVLAGFMELVSEPFLERFPDAVINIHPSPLPAFPGLKAIERAIGEQVETFGVTVHYVDRGIDTGQIILQESVELPGARDPSAVLEALRPIEHRLLPEAVRQIAAREAAQDLALAA
jgi:phosphoribosylglycinamide formyltransferase-1